ncbi:17.5 kDa class I heat shock protein-like [Diospyros lotus]|uniref:17.5 kDa class I heat shock protein-like n=1 Tax=Diospyros lotus TaxID=55363 RepID=UPI00225B8502|nr:17.5 kDa class I heat shock protein-like [Diospyros lotus]
MSRIQSVCSGHRGNAFNPFSPVLVWDPLKDCPFPCNSGETPAMMNARTDWKETPKGHLFTVDLPGVKEEEVKVEVEDDKVLRISGERSVEEKKDDKERWHRVERSGGKFMRRFRLPEKANIEEVKASMENGVLTVFVPKEAEEEEEEAKRPRSKIVEISGQ